MTQAEKQKEYNEKRKAEKMAREHELLGEAGNKWIDACLKDKCEEINEEYAGGGVSLFNCRKHDWRAKVHSLIKKNNPTARYCEIFNVKEEGVIQKLANLVTGK